MKKMMAFHIGREKELCAGEISAVFGTPPEVIEDIALVNISELKNLQTVQDSLGGTLKISEILDQFPNASPSSTFSPAERIATLLETIKPEGKMSFALSLIPSNPGTQKNLLKDIKKIFQGKNRNARWINTPGKELSTGLIIKSGVMKAGTDLTLITNKGESLIARTVAIQNVALYAERDYFKPVRLSNEGMLPPKLAQLMINLARHELCEVSMGNKRSRSDTVSPSLTLYDPFCGSGTVLGEALIKGMNVIGSDIDPKAISATEKNLNALRQSNRFAISKTQTQRLFQKNTCDLSPDDFHSPSKHTATPEHCSTPDLVVSELDLGPPMGQPSPFSQIESIQKKLLPLYKDALKALALAITTRPIAAAMRAHHSSHAQAKKIPVILAFPLHYSPQGPHPLPHLDELIKDAGFTPLHRFAYHRPGQGVGREIRVLEIMTL